MQFEWKSDPFIFTLIEKGNYKKFKEYIKTNPLSVNEKHWEFISPLLYAIDLKRNDMVLSLIQEGADLNFSTDEEIKPLFLAYMTGNEVIFKMLVEAGADINIISPNFGSLLHFCVYGNDLKLTDYLLEKGIDTKLEDNYGRTALDLCNSMLMNVADKRDYSKLCDLLTKVKPTFST